MFRFILRTVPRVILHIAFFTLSLLPASLAAAPPAQTVCSENIRDQLQQEHQVLLEAIEQHNKLYEVGQPAISDDEYDALTHRQRFISRCLGAQNSSTASPSSAPPLDQRHRYPMGSLKKASGQDDIEAFLDYARKLGSPVIVQPKIDGIAIELVYQNGQLVQALTRGQWRTGTGINLLPMLPSIPAIPATLPNNRNEIVLRGELYTLSDNPFATSASSSRHYVAGLINRKQAPHEELNTLKFFPWQWVNSPLASLRADVREFEEWGFTGVQSHSHQIKQLAEIVHLRTRYNKEDKFPLDGIVIKLDNRAIQKRLGHLDGTPYWALAWKFPAATIATQITGIRWTIGRTGQITVLLDLQPVQLQGITISTVNAGPIEYFSGLDMATADTISISLKGAATPVLGKTLLRPQNRTKPQLPDQDRYHGLSCLSFSENCREQFLARLKWLTGRNGIDIPEVNHNDLEILANSGQVKQLADIFTLTAEEVSSEAYQILQNPQLSLGQALRTLGIPGIGKKRSDLLAKKAGSWQVIRDASSDQLQQWLKCSPSEAEAVRAYLNTEEIKTLSHHLFKSS